MSSFSIDETTAAAPAFSTEDVLWTVGLCAASLGLAPLLAFYMLLVGGNGSLRRMGQAKRAHQKRSFKIDACWRARRKCAFAHLQRLSFPEQRAMILQDHARGVVAGGAGDAAAGMGAGAAMVKSLQRPAIIRVAEHRPRREQLVQRQGAVEDVAADEAEIALQINR